MLRPVHHARVEQQLVADRRRPCALNHVRVGPHVQRDVGCGHGADVGQPGAMAVRVVVVVAGDLVARRRLPREPAGVVHRPEPVNRRAAQVGRINVRARRQVPVVVGDVAIVHLPREGRIEPETILFQRTAEGRRNPVDRLDVVGIAQAPRAQLVGDVGAGQVCVRVVRKETARERVGALPRDHVERGAARRELGRQRADFDHVFRVVRVCEREVVGAAGRRALHVEAIHEELLIRKRAAVEDEAAEVLPLLAADVGVRAARRALVGIHAGRQERHVLPLAAGGHRVEDLPGDHGRLFDVDDVHDRRLTRDGDRFRDVADLQLGVDVGGEIRGELHALAHRGAEAGQHEGNRVGPRPQFHDPVLAASIGDSRSGFFDQGGAAGLDRDPGQHRTGSICDGDRRHWHFPSVPRLPMASGGRTPPQR